jgi:hypothetical protein
MTTESSINYPLFHLQCADNLVFNTFQCMHVMGANVVPIQSRACPSGSGDQNVCRTVPVDDLAVTLGTAADEIRCFITTKAVNASNNNQNQMIKLELEGLSYNPSVWIAPNNFSEVTLAKNRYGDDEKLLDLWRPNLVYLDTVSQPFNYHINVAIDSFFVPHFEVADFYDGWRSMGDIGGFIFLVVLLHAVVLMLIECIVPRDSKFLSGKLTPSQVGYDQIGGDNSSL